MKVAVIGGGSTYTPELIMGFMQRAESFPLTELWLEDIDAERLKIVGGFAQRIAASHHAPFKVILSADQREAVLRCQLHHHPAARGTDARPPRR